MAASEFQRQSAVPGATPMQPARSDRYFSLLRSRSGLVYLLLAATIADALQCTDPDLWGHIYFGQAVLREHQLILHDAASYSAFGHLYRNHEWLTETLMALTYDHFGIVGLKVWKFLCVVGILAGVAAAMAETGARRSVQSVILGVVALAIMPQMQFRPQLYTFALSSASLALLARDNYRRRAPLWLIVPIMILWANLHGGFPVGIAMLGVYAAIVSGQEILADEGFARPARLALTATAGAFATLATPWGIGLWYQVGHAMFVSNIRAIIVDWMPLSAALARQWHSSPLGLVYYACVIGLMAGTALTFLAAPNGGRDLPLAAIGAMMSWAAVSAARNMPLAAIACAAPLARHTELLMQPRSAPRRLEGEQRAGEVPAESELLLPGSVAVAIALALRLFSPRLALDHPYPVQAVAFMEANHQRGNVLGDFDWGQYLIWHLQPDSKVFIDGRYDTVFPPQVINDYLRFYFDWPGATAVLTDYQHDFVLIPPNAPANALMARAPGWKLVYRDRSSVLYTRVDNPLPAVPTVGANEATAACFFP